MVKILDFHCLGWSSVPGRGTEILQAAGQKKQNYYYANICSPVFYSDSLPADERSQLCPLTFPSSILREKVGGSVLITVFCEVFKNNFYWRMKYTHDMCWWPECPLAGRWSKAVRKRWNTLLNSNLQETAQTLCCECVSCFQEGTRCKHAVWWIIPKCTHLCKQHPDPETEHPGSPDIPLVPIQELPIPPCPDC